MYALCACAVITGLIIRNNRTIRTIEVYNRVEAYIMQCQQIYVRLEACNICYKVIILEVYNRVEACHTCCKVIILEVYNRVEACHTCCKVIILEVYNRVEACNIMQSQQEFISELNEARHNSFVMPTEIYILVEE